MKKEDNKMYKVAFAFDIVTLAIIALVAIGIIIAWIAGGNVVSNHSGYYYSSSVGVSRSTLLSAFHFGMGFSLFFVLIPLAWVIPMTIKCFAIMKGRKECTTAFAVCSLIFCNLITGILLLVAKNEENNTYAETDQYTDGASENYYSQNSYNADYKVEDTVEVFDNDKSDVVYCTNCGEALNKTDKFCPKCGTQVKVD